MGLLAAQPTFTGLGGTKSTASIKGWVMRKLTAKKSYLAMTLLESTGLLVLVLLRKLYYFSTTEEKVFIGITYISYGWRSICTFPCHLKIGVLEYPAVTVSLHRACTGPWCPLWTIHPALPVRHFHRQASREALWFFFWKPRSFYERATKEYFKYSYLTQFLNHCSIFSHNK